MKYLLLVILIWSSASYGDINLDSEFQQLVELLPKDERDIYMEYWRIVTPEKWGDEKINSNKRRINAEIKLKIYNTDIEDRPQNIDENSWRDLIHQASDRFALFDITYEKNGSVMLSIDLTAKNCEELKTIVANDTDFKLIRTTSISDIDGMSCFGSVLSISEKTFKGVVQRFMQIKQLEKQGIAVDLYELMKV